MEGYEISWISRICIQPNPKINTILFSHSLDALQVAKKHIEEEYSVVGIVEDLANTMVLLEHYIPGIHKYLVF